MSSRIYRYEKTSRALNPTGGFLKGLKLEFADCECGIWHELWSKCECGPGDGFCVGHRVASGRELHMGWRDLELAVQQASI